MPDLGQADQRSLLLLSQ